MTRPTNGQFEAGIFALMADGWTLLTRRAFDGQLPAADWVKRNCATAKRKNPSQQIRGSVVEVGTWLTLEGVLAEYEQKRKAGDPEFNEAAAILVGDKITASDTPVQPESILGLWRITHMEMWDQEFVDAEGEGYIRLDQGGSGEFQFGYIHGWIDHDFTEREGKPVAEWSWEGTDEMEQASGRGWAALQDDGTIKGKLSIHQGEKSGFVAVRKGEAKQSEGKKMVVVFQRRHKRPKKR
jgi:hypothetical protein